jgi:hypothetical protein
MADIAKRDENRVPSLLGLSSVNGLDVVTSYINPSTHRLLVDIDAADITSVTGVADGDAINAANKGIILMGSDGSNYQAVLMDNTGAISMSVVGSQSVALQQKVTSNDLIVTLDSEAIALTTSTAEIGNVKNSGTFAVQATLAAETTKVIGTINVAASQTIAVTNATAANLKVAATLDAETSKVIGTVNQGTSPWVVSGAVTNTVLSVVGNGAGATAQRVTLANDSTGIVALTTSTASIGKLATNTGVDIGDVDITSVIPLTGATNLGKARDLAIGATDTGVAVLAIRDDALSAITPAENDWEGLRIDSVGALWVNGSAFNQPVLGTIAHDAADSGNPIKIGAKAETSPKGITPVADGDRTDLYSDSDGMQMVKVNTSGADLISERVTNTNGTSTDFTNFSAVASTYNYVTAITVYNSSTTDGYVDFRSSTDGAVLWTMPLPALGGSCISSTTPLFKTVAADALSYDVSGAITTVYISVSGFQSKV